jgi:hypothetical protein
VKTWVALLAMTACLQAAAGSTCPVDGFYPTSGAAGLIVDHAVADPKPEIGRHDETLWFDYVEVGGPQYTGWQSVYEVLVNRDDKGSFRVVLLRAKSGATANDPGPGVVDSRRLPAAIAERLHRGVIPILARTHYPAELLEKDPPNYIQCTDGETVYVTVEETGNRFGELVGEARPYGKNSEAGSVQALGHALRHYALRRIDERGLEAPLKLVEAHAKPDNGHAR